MALRDGYAISIPATSAGSIVVIRGGYHVRTPAERYADGFAAGLAASPAPDAVPPVVTWVSPTPGVTPGEPGGFPSSRRDAETTAVELNVADIEPGLTYLCISLRVYQDDETYGTEHTVYRDGEYKLPYRGVSTTSGTINDMDFSIQRAGGWTGRYLEFTIDALDAAGNKTTETLIYELPSGASVVEEEPVDENDGTIDHVARALDRLPHMYRSEDDE